MKMAVWGAGAMVLLMISPVAMACSSCPDKNTCCPGVNGSIGCCPVEAGNAVCCPDGLRCCPEGSICGDKSCSFTKGQLPDPHASEWPVPMGMAGWQPKYHLCFVDGLLHESTLALPGNLSFGYYSDLGQIEKVSDAVASKIKVVFIAQHGASRNGDDYFCAGRQAAAMQTSYKREEILVVAPRFMEPQDSPAAGTVYWNGSFVQGYWRAGADSDPRSDPNPQRRSTISSFSILDLLVTTAQKQFPNLHHITIGGHSSGGQIVQRHAMLTHLLPTPSVPLRHVASNPSSFGFLDSRRWNGSAFEALNASAIAACPEYDSWHFGLHAHLVPYGLDIPGGLQAAIDAYRRRDVRYVQGHNDTCNEALIPGCESHGLETTCMDLLEGEYRLQRGRRYYAYVQQYYHSTDKPVHKFYEVPNVGHDHSLIYQSQEGLDAIFAGE